jgi:hypothetical protein
MSLSLRLLLIVYDYFAGMATDDDWQAFFKEEYTRISAFFVCCVLDHAFDTVL